LIPARREPSAPDRLAEERAAPVEEHLLVCDECRGRLAAWDTYVAEMREAMEA
jgi:anti-sigma factor RsiW